MKKEIFNFFLLFIALLVFTTACKKQPGENPISEHAISLPHGNPNGNTTTKMIGPEGGQIKTADGTIAIQVPAGALTATTEFKITPITRTLPSSTGQAFRLNELR